ncbi:Multiple epidermal growth factor-like domains protein 8 [Actinomortierella ambigua]|uniref:Multiple epidermal growth factor-like domains protein 8 n=1 Tax=Actinomortierella ambigua TaxID=1343610 RepID=A0A9P6PZE2_9FUNG|nr:Multiple epidermal growth factor-like domains protein 8 [Actinomortierella ambigua]
MTTLTFRRITTQDPATRPRPRQGHASVFHKGCLYVFGGRVQGSGRIYVNDLWKYDPDKNTWEEILAVNPSQVPCKRHNHTCVMGMDDAIYVFGGQTVSNKYLGDLWRFDLGTQQWSELTQSQPRHSHGAWKHGNTMLVFGGRTGLKPAVYSNEVLAYDFESNKWSTPYSGDDQGRAAAAAGAPHPRSYTSIVKCDEYLVVFGGYWWDGKEHYFDDTFGFSLTSHKWIKLSPLGNERVPHCRNRHGLLPLPSVADGGFMSGMVIFGGNFYANDRGSDKFFGDAWMFGTFVEEPLTSGKWNKVTLLGDIPCPRGHVAWVEDDQVPGRSWMFGGEAKRERFNDLYEVRVEVSAT